MISEVRTLFPLVIGYYTVVSLGITSIFGLGCESSEAPVEQAETADVSESEVTSPIGDSSFVLDGSGDADSTPPQSSGCFSDLDCVGVFPSPPSCQTARCNLSGNFCYIGNAPDGLFCAAMDHPCGGSCLGGQCELQICAEVCSNGLDDDFDGKTDCLDQDCLQSPECVDQLCSPGFALTCGTELIASTLGPGAWKGSDAYECVSWKMGGPERVYRIQPGGLSTYTVELLAKAVDLRLLVVLEDPAEPCGRGACVAFGEDSVSWPSQLDKTYLVLVDGYAGTAGAFALRMNCTAPVEWSCTDGEDDDGDGFVDCADSDCKDSPQCSACVPIADLSCGSSLVYATDSPMATQIYSSYGCQTSEEWDNNGREIAFRIPAPSLDTAYSATLTTNSPNHHLFVLPEVSGGTCDASGCIVAGQSVTWTQQAGESVILVVDGPADTTAPFGLDLECMLDTELDCLNGIDDDLDGNTDCSDTECLLNEQCNVCKPALSLACNSEVLLSTTMPLSTNLLSGGACSAGDFSGPEIVMTFHSGIDQPVRIIVEDPDGPTSLSVMERTVEIPCNPSECIDFSDWTILFPAKADTTYDIVVDTVSALPTSFGLKVECGTATEIVCNNAQDEDLDGLVDCEDPDCQNLSLCADCTPLFSLTCGQTVKIPDMGPLSTSNLSTYSCNNEPFDGPEIAFHLAAANAQTATISLQEAPQGSQLFAVSGSSTAACDPQSCIATGSDTIVVDLKTTPDPVTIVVDTSTTTTIDTGPITLSITCSADTETFCDDTWDNDGDGMLDCADPDCVTTPACITCKPSAVLSCGTVLNGTLVAGGAIADYGCLPDTKLAASELVWELSVPTALALNAKFLTKQTGMRMFLVDPSLGGPCSATSCVASSDQLLKYSLTPNKKYLFIVDGESATTGAFSVGTSCVGLAELCTNQADDDGDTLVDCLDPDCYTHVQCVPPENCSNGIDDDLDTLTDCDDPDCAALPTCNLVEICDNGTDDDSDGTVDCQDDECKNFTACIPVELCNNLIDDDGDGMKDCEDTDCLLTPECIVVVPENCINGKDDDGDSFTDCADSDCANVGSCGQCTLTGVLYCGSKLSGTMTSGSSGNNMFLYPCDGGKVYGGPEKTYRINLGTASSATVLFSGSPELAGHHIEFAGAGCSLSGCKNTYTGSSWVVPLTLKAGIAHYITLDSLVTGNYNFSLDVQCN